VVCEPEAWSISQLLSNYSLLQSEMSVASVMPSLHNTHT